MAMDSIIQNNKVSPYKPAFPLFDISLLARSDVEFDMSGLIPIEQYSKSIQERLIQDIDIDGGFDLFCSPNEKKVVRSFQERDQPCSLGKNLGSKKNRTAISMRKNSAYRNTKPGKKEVVKSSTLANMDHKHHLSSDSCLMKRPLASLGDTPDTQYTFPSLASILGEDESLFSSDEDEPPLEKKPSIKPTEKVEKQTNSFLQIDLSGSKKDCEEMPLLMNGIFNEALSIFDQNVSIFAKLFCDPSPANRKGESLKKVKYNPCFLEDEINAFGLYHNIASNEKQGNFDLSSEKRIVDSFHNERKLEESAKFRFHDNSFSNSATVHL